MRSASIRTSSVPTSSATTTRIAFEPASIAPSRVRVAAIDRHAITSARDDDLRVIPRPRADLAPRASGLLCRGLVAAAFAATTARRHVGLIGPGVLRDLDLVGERHTRQHLDVDAIGQPELDVVLHERLRRGLDLDERLGVLVVLDERL